MSWLPGASGFVLILFFLLPRGVANRHWRLVTHSLSLLMSVHLMAALAVLADVLLAGSDYAVLGAGVDQLFSLSVWLNGSSVLMLTLVAFIAWVVSRYSVRCLDGEADLGNYFRWLGATTGAISLSVVAGNLLLMLLMLLLTSVGLSQLLTHYRDRAATRSAAALRFRLSSLADMCLLFGAVVLYRETGTLELPLLFDAVSSATAAGPVPAIAAAGWLLVLGAFLKSVQLPFHTWLPETMGTPTPVSALMHAGIVNAGGYLLIRLAPVVMQAPAAMSAAAALGAMTALTGAMVMLSQTSVKRSLAWSTIAQMGLMMLQCGLGAFSAAMLHLIAHSAYKAWAFLASGDVLRQPGRSSTSIVPTWKQSCASAALALFVVLLVFALSSLAGMSPGSKPGGYLLGMIFCLGLVRSLAAVFIRGLSSAILLTGAVTLLLSGYLVAFVAVDSVVANAGVASVQPSAAAVLTLVVAAIWLTVIMVESQIPRLVHTPWMRRLYVHSSSGFYMDLLWKRLARTLSF